MTPFAGPRDEPMTTDEFETELEALVADARDGPARIEGAHNVRSPHRDVPDYTIEISEIVKRIPDWLRRSPNE